MSAPLISVVTVSLNSVSTLERTIQSVIGQTYPQIEFIIIDGGSTDGTIDIIQANKGNIAYWISEKDTGVYDAINKGISASNGEWIYVLGSDDILYNNRTIEYLFSGSDHIDCDFLFGDVVSESFRGRYDGDFSFKKLLKRNICQQAIFYKRHLFESVGKFNLRFRSHADWEFNIRCFLDDGVRRKYVSIIIANFAAGGLSSNYDIPFLEEFLIPQKIDFLYRSGDKKLMSPVEFDEWCKKNIETRNFISIVRDASNSEAGKLSIPTPDHFYPLLYVLGAADTNDSLTFDFEGIQNSSISMRCFRFG